MKSNIFFSQQKEFSIPPRIELFLSLLLIAYFVAKALYFALAIQQNLFPDEISWYGISKLFSLSWLPPGNSDISFEFGPITNKPILYFFLMGKLLSLNFFPVDDLIFLRCMNVIIVTFTVIYGWKLGKLMLGRPVSRLIFLIMLTNTLMFTFLAGSVNYDNLTNLCAVLGVYFYVSFSRRNRLDELLLFFIFLLLGPLVKISLVPFAGIVLILFVIQHGRQIMTRHFLQQSFSQLSKIKFSVLLLSLLALFALNLNLYLGNYLKYHTLRPRADQVLSLDQALQNRVFARDYIVRTFKQGKITYDEARKMAYDVIEHEGDREGTLILLQQAKYEKNQKHSFRMNPYVYSLPWLNLAFSKIFGIMGHKSMEKEGDSLLPYYMLLTLFVLQLLLYFPAGSQKKEQIFMLALIILYPIVIIKLVNFGAYNNTGVIELALQGRYLFPVLVPFYLLISRYINKNNSHIWQLLLLAAVAAVFFSGEFPWFMQQVSPDWLR